MAPHLVTARSVCVDILIVFALAGLNGCAAADTTESETIVRDSAGVTIVETSAISVPTWPLGQQPVIQLGSADGEQPAYLFHRIRAAYYLSGGTIVVVDGATSEIRYFDSNGKHLRTIGGRGAGPLEFQNFASVIRLDGDSLLIHDRQNTRLAIISPNGDILPSIPTADIPKMASGAALGRLGARRFAVTSTIPFHLGGPTSYRRDTVVVAVTEPGSRSAREVWRAPSTEYYMFYQAATDQTGPGYGHPFGHRAHAAIWNSRLVVGASEVPEIRVIDEDGRVRTIVRRTDATPQPLSGSVVDDYLQQIGLIDGQRTADELRKQLDWFPRDRVVPAYSAFQTDDAGFLWVRDFMPSGVRRDSDWTGYAPDGSIAARITTPAGFEVLSIAVGHVVGRVRDEMDVEYVRVYSLSRAAR